MHKPGTAIFHAAGLTPNATSELWDGWGVEYCRREKRKAIIVKRLTLAYQVQNAGELVERVLTEMPEEQQGIRGLGDVVAIVAEPVRRWVTGKKKKKCGGCGKRQAKLNRWFPNPWRRKT